MREKKSVAGGIIAGVFGAVCIAVICLHAWNTMENPQLAKQNHAANTAETEDIWKDEETLDTNENITLSLKEAVLGESEQQKKLQVFTQEISDITKVTDKGWGPLNFGKKDQYVKYSGTAVYTVDLANMDEDHLSINEKDKTLTIYIPHVEEKLDINEEETQAEETQNVGIFSIGDLRLSEDERKEVISKVRDEMEQKLQEEKSGDNADRMAKMSVWEIYQPVVSKISPDYTVKVEFEKA